MEFNLLLKNLILNVKTGKKHEYGKALMQIMKDSPLYKIYLILQKFG